MMIEKQTPDVTTSHSTRLSKNDSQVAGYAKGGLGGISALYETPQIPPTPLLQRGEE